MQPPPSGMQSLVKVAALTFAGAFLGVLAMTKVPTTLDEAKAVVLPALGAAIAAEIVFLRQWIASMLTGVPVPSMPAPTPTTPETPAAKRGFASLRALAFSSLVGLLAVVGIGANCNGPPGVPQGTVQDVTVGVNAAVCALNTYSSDVAAGMGWQAVIEDVAVKCGLPVAQAVGLLDAHRGAMVREGYVLKPNSPAGHP